MEFIVAVPLHGGSSPFAGAQVRVTDPENVCCGSSLAFSFTGEQRKFQSLATALKEMTVSMAVRNIFGIFLDTQLLERKR
jgi:hypothetical protein